MSTDQSTGRVAVITGASSGIADDGGATARALADGHRVLLTRRADRIHAVADELGNGAIAVEADVTDRGSIVEFGTREAFAEADAAVLPT